MDQIVFKTRILIIGANGSLGRRCAEVFQARPDIELMLSSATDRGLFPSEQFVKADATKADEIKKLVASFRPELIINASAFTNVDLCESERQNAWLVNVRLVENLADAARIFDSYIIHISTDYVFDGQRGPYYETDKTNPVSYYGRTKLASENTLKISGVPFTILRTNVLYGLFPGGKLDFVRWVVNSIRKGETIRIVTDQINNPTFVDDLVSAIELVYTFRKQGIYHTGGMEFLNRYEFTLRIAEVFNLDTSLIKAIKTEDLHQPAKRPLKSGLFTIKAQSEFGYRPHKLDESLYLMKKILEQ